MAVSKVDGSHSTSDDLWRLAFEIQAEIIRISGSDMSHREAFVDFLKSHRVAEAMASLQEPRVSVAIRVESSRSKGAETPHDILSRWIHSLEEDAAYLAHILHCEQGVLKAIRDAAFDYLKVEMRSDISNARNERRFERAMYNFAYGLSHEINNPLANIAARASLLSKEIEKPSHIKSLNTIVESAIRAHEMLAEMMLAVQSPSIQCKPDDLRNFLLQCSREWSASSEACQLTWQANICDEFLWCRIDRTSLAEAIGAAVRNSLDACRPGDTIELVADRVESEAGQLEIRVAIVDNGPGLSEATLEQAWDLYFCNREAGRGLGIGLAKLRRVVELHRGRVWIESKERAGCSVEIRLPWESRKRNR
jgi:signal transduction histidine kinase